MQLATMVPSQLLEIQEQLNDLGKNLIVDMRGAGQSAFLYICSNNRAAEVSMEGQGFFVEYWDESDEKSERESIRNEILYSIFEVKQNLMIWF